MLEKILTPRKGTEGLTIRLQSKSHHERAEAPLDV